MNKTVNINLGGVPFIINEDAFELLHNYLQQLENKFTNEAERKEIMADIEARISDIFTTRLAKDRKVVEMSDAAAVIAQLGKPEEIAGEQEDANTGSSKQTAGSSTNFSDTNTSTGKKLFRDTENKRVGGVISGLCHYFGWGDPTWVRVGVVALCLLSKGIGLHLFGPIFILYIILLIVMPKADTAAAKLQMKGKPVTLNNIEQEVRESFQTAKHSIQTGLDANLLNNTQVTSSVGRAFQIFGKIFLGIVIVICFCLLLAILSGFFGLNVLGGSSFNEITHLIVNNSWMITIFSFGFFLTFGIPVIRILYQSIRILLGQAKDYRITRALGLLWLVGLGLFFGVILLVQQNFKKSATITEKVKLSTPSSAVLQINLTDTLNGNFKIGDEENHLNINLFGVMGKTADGFSIGEPSIELAVSPDSNFYLERVVSSKGKTFETASQNARMVRYKFSQSAQDLNLDGSYFISPTDKWRKQELKLVIYVPANKKIKFSENIDHLSATVKGDNSLDEEDFGGNTFYVKENKIVCENCSTHAKKSKNWEDDSEDDSEDDEAVSNIKNMKDMNVNINQNGVTINGKNEDGKKVHLKINQNGKKEITIDSIGK